MEKRIRIIDAEITEHLHNLWRLSGGKIGEKKRREGAAPVKAENSLKGGAI